MTGGKPFKTLRPFTKKSPNMFNQNPKSKLQNQKRNKIQHPNSKNQTPKSKKKKKELRSKIQDPDSKIQKPKSKSKFQNHKSRKKNKIQHPNSKNQTPKSKLQNPKKKRTKIQNPRSKNRNQNPNSKIQTPKSRIKTYINLWFMTGPQTKWTNIFCKSSAQWAKYQNGNHQKKSGNRSAFSLKIHESGKMNEKKIARVSPRPIGPKKSEKTWFCRQYTFFLFGCFFFFFPHLFFSSVAYCSFFFVFCLLIYVSYFFLICSLFVFLLFSVFANVFLVFFCAVH